MSLTNLMGFKKEDIEIMLKIKTSSHSIIMMIISSIFAFIPGIIIGLLFDIVFIICGVIIIVAYILDLFINPFLFWGALTITFYKKLKR